MENRKGPSWSLRLVTITLLFSLTTACLMDFTHTLASSQRVTVGAVVVEEKIYRADAFPDPRYVRVYWVQRGPQQIEVGRYEDEGRQGMATPPVIVADWLVIMSGAHLFFWQAETAARHFYPFDAIDWGEYAEARQLNGHYDYAATAVQIDGPSWQLTYSCSACLADQPPTLHFRSADGGQSFYVVD